MIQDKLDDIGVPTTIMSFTLNLLSIMQIEIINIGFTMILSSLSGIYLLHKIKNEKKKGKLLDEELNEKN
jgi:formate-dependent nitrite reductase membrane component NrfD